MKIPRSIQCLLLGAGIYLTGCCLSGCGRITGNHDPLPAGSQAPLFTLLSPDSTHIGFTNTLTEGLNTNVLMYEYFYNGGGVAIGDFNGDGLPDIYFSGNMTDDKLYLNRGHFQFEDVTDIAGVAGRPGPWKTGVSVADVNGDGRMDIFLCYSGKLPGAKRIKQLFINEGNDGAGIPHFSEQAARFGLADSSYTTQAYFFDYNRDGYLDLLLLNHNPNSLPILNEVSTAAILKRPNPLCGVRLFRNDKGVFHDVTEQAGLSSSDLTYGLGAAIADINGDGWPDIYISNDYNVPDAYYVNQGNGHFTNRLTQSFGHISQFSMGNNVADINNDGLPDIFTLDMLPENNHRQKLLFAPDNYEKFDLNLRSGFYYQYMRNMLQLNNGDGTFSEIGQLAGLSNTDWSWAPLWADFDNDGWKDLFVTNGYARDYTNMDFIKFMEEYTHARGRLRREDVLDLVDHMPSSHVSSYLFRNNGGLNGNLNSGLHFSDMSTRWGISGSSNSNGAAWADLDNDGDLDLVVNNINQPAFIYKNQARERGGNHYLSVKLEGAGFNTQGVGARLTLYNKGSQQYLEQMPAQGYQSCVSPVLHFGTGTDTLLDSLRVIWPGGRRQVLTRLGADRLLTLREKDAAGASSPGSDTSAVAFKEIRPPIDFHAASALINDFKRQPLLVNPLSFSGPCLVKGDVNGDGLDDLYAGGGNGQAGALYLQQKNGSFLKMAEPAFEADKLCEDADAVFFDANGDGRTDLYIASGGYHQYAPGDTLLQDRLYLGDGKGHFRKSTDALPSLPGSKSCVRVADMNRDGFPDLFVGGRVIPGSYPQTPASYLLINDGKGHFSEEGSRISLTDSPAIYPHSSPEGQKIGMVTDAVWTDLNGDGWKDLVVVGEWMPITVFINKGGQLVNRTKDYFEEPYYGWWNKLWVGDLDKDGRPDIIAGNLGMNSQCKADDRHPATLYYKDFDGNGTIDPILCFYIGDSSYPFITRDELLQQIGNMSKRFPDYKSYADAGITNIFREDELKGAVQLKANCLRTCYFAGGADGKFHERKLPVQAQFSPVFTITVLDYDGDGKEDLLLCGNISHARLRFGKYDANYGILLKGDGKGDFRYIPQPRSGLHLHGDIRSVAVLGNRVLFGTNQADLQAYKCRSSFLVQLPF